MPLLRTRSPAGCTITEALSAFSDQKRRVTLPHAAREPIRFSKNTLVAMDCGAISA